MKLPLKKSFSKILNGKTSKRKFYGQVLPILLSVVVVAAVGGAQIFAQATLESNNYRLTDTTIDSGGGAKDSGSGNYSILSSIANPGADSRLESSSYALGSGFPNGIQANVPLINCAETNTNSGSAVCFYPNSNGAIGQCGSPGCYNRAKFEINRQSNPYDTLYLVKVRAVVAGIDYYLQSDHSIATTYDINDYMTICDIQGRDANVDNPDCFDLSDTEWDTTLQATNIYGLLPNTNYQVSARALSGDFTETQFGPVVSFTTVSPDIVFDLDIGTTSGVNNAGPYTLSLGNLLPGAINTATDRVWLDLGTNTTSGATVYVRDINAGIKFGGNTIPSQEEDLSVDAGADGGFGIQAANLTQTSLGPLTADTAFNKTGTLIGSLTLTNKALVYTTGPIASGRAANIFLTKPSSGMPIGTYLDSITYIAVGNY